MNIPVNIKLEYVCCPLTCSKNDQFLFKARDIMGNLPGEYNLVKCKTCGLIRLNPRPTQNTIGYYYPESYAQYSTSKVKNEIIDTAGLFKKKIFRPLIKKIFNFNYAKIPKIKPGDMLEIGCASGYFLKEMRDKGWNVKGIEFSAHAAKFAREAGFDIYNGPLEEAPEVENRFDLIVGFMVLEHLHNIIDCLKKLRRFSKDNAWLVLSVPNAGSLEFNIFKDNWHASHAPHHLFYFTPKTIRKVLIASGWEIKKIYHQRLLHDLIASIGFSLKKKGFVNVGKKFIEYPENAGKWQYFLYPLAWLLSIFGQTGRMTVWAKVKN